MKRSFSNISDFPYNTNDGGAWLRKALDPAELAVEVIGMPDTNTNARTILNYQSQFDIPPPDPDSYIATSVAGYDANLYLYQNPIIFGMSVSYPQGTTNPLMTAVNFDFSNLSFILPVGTAPRTVTVYMNEQIEGTTYEEKRKNFTKYCQRYRMIYGGVQGIPACSDMFDSGTIEATQQIFNPENSIASDFADPRGSSDDNYGSISALSHTLPDVISATGKTSRKQTYRPNDFPDNGVAIQNPSSLYCRYKEGVYMPYKIKNPVIHPYLNSEEYTLIESPYVVTSLAIAQIIDSNGIKSSWMDYDPATRMFKAGNYSELNPSNASAVLFWIKCYTKTGIPFWFVAKCDCNDRTISYPNSYTFEFPELANAWQTGTPLQYQEFFDNVQTPTSATRIYSLTIANAELGPNSEDKFSSEPFKVLTSPEANIGVINFKSIAVQASIRLIFRLGFEYMIVAGGVYSPFKHKAPKYDQKAIDSYVSATHNMRDAFYGDAATSAGHQEYSTRILDLVAGNAGSGWYGLVGV